MTPVIGGLISIGSALIDKLIPDPTEKARAQLELLRLEQEGELKKMEAGLSAIIAEAQSGDPWTSRARPSFLYIMYIIILMSIPMGILSAFQPEIADRVTKGMTGYLASIPEALWVLFGTGYLGYAGFRTWDKVKSK